MIQRIFLFLLLISVFTYTGCGGGGSKKKEPPLLSTIQGMVTFDMSGSTSYYRSDSMTTLSKSAFFPKAAVRKTHFSPPAVPNEKIVKFRPETSYSQVNTIVAKMGGRIKKKLYGTDSTYLITIEEQTFSKSAANLPSGVEYIEDNLIYHALEVPNDPYYKPPYNWNHKMLNLEKAWDVQRGVSIEPGKEIIVAVLDTGITPNHEDLKGNLVPGHDCIDGDSDPSDMQNGHGTHVAGIIGAIADNTFGTAGVGWNAVKIMPIRVLNSEGTGYLADIIEGFNHAVNNEAKVINLSLGLIGNPVTEESNTFRTTIDDAINNKHITVIAAAGNEGGSVCFPANYDPVIAVASLDHTCSRPSYSNFGPKIDFCAPGGGSPRTQHQAEWAVKTVFNTYYSGYAYMAGTSQAAPHISGLAALLYAQNPDITPADVEKRLIGGCIDLGNPDHYGNGLPDAYAVLKEGILPEMAKVKVFIGTPEGMVISNLQHVGASGDFTLSDLEAGTYNIYAFVDSIDNNKIDPGEKYGYTQVYLPKDTLVTEVSIALKSTW